MRKLNLQFFAGEDDTILPDDFEDTPTEEVTAEEDSLELDAEETTEVEDTKPTEEVTEPEVTEPKETQAALDKLKIKFNHEEREISIDEARELAQKGLNYDKAVERAKQEARDEYIAQQGYEWQGKPIKTEAEYKQALQEKELMEKYKDVPEELRKEILENRRFREQYQTQQQQQEQKEKETQQYQEFMESFPDVKPEQIKPETWEKVNQGVPLKYAYMEQERAELLTKAKVTEQNQKNRERAPVAAVSQHGSGEVEADAFLEGFDS